MCKQKLQKEITAKGSSTNQYEPIIKTLETAIFDKSQSASDKASSVPKSHMKNPNIEGQFGAQNEENEQAREFKARL